MAKECKNGLDGPFGANISQSRCKRYEGKMSQGRWILYVKWMDDKMEPLFQKSIRKATHTHDVSQKDFGWGFSSITRN